MQCVLVLSKNKQSLMPCHPARARRLLKEKCARVFKANPFTIILTERTEGVTQHAELNIDPGSKTTGFAYVVDCQNGKEVFFAANLDHRGEEIKQSLSKKSAIRRLEVDHIVPRALGGTDRVDNLTLACNSCNRRKNAKPIAEFLKDDKKRLKIILSQTKAPLKDAAAVNATRYRIGEELKKFNRPVTFWTGGRTKYNRVQQNYHKDHWIDAACIGERGGNVFISPKLRPLTIQAYGRGNRQMCRVDRFGFPRTSSKEKKMVCGFKTGDHVIAIVPSGKKAGNYVGRVAVRSSGNFNIKTNTSTVQGISYKHCRLIQSADGYNYLGGSASSLS